MNFIELRGKVPKDGFSHKYSFRTAQNWDDVGVVVEHPYVVFDVDNQITFQLLYSMIEEMNIKTRVMRTSRGGHFWFKSDEPLSNNTGINTPVSIDVDIRSYGKHSMCVVRQVGEWREWIKFDDNVDYIPAWLTPIKHDEKFLGAREGDDRNNRLFSYIITLTNAGLGRDDIRTTFRLINDYLFEDALSDEELSTITRDASFENLHDSFFEGRRFKHNTFANYFTNDNNVFILNGRLYMYNDGYYSDDEREINKRMIDYVESLTRNQRQEVMSYIKLIAKAPIDKSPYHISTLNGVIDVREPNSLQPYSPDIFTTNKLPVYWNPEAYDENVDKTLNKLVCNDQELRLVIEEMIGYALLPTSRFQKAFILTGEGSNGKSTFLEMLIEFLGNENVSSLSLKELNHNFKIAEITSKLANIGDDISGEYLEDSSIFKKLVTGEDITVDKKNEQPYKLRNTAKLIFAANELPMTMDKTKGMERRLTIIPFNATFSQYDEDYDPFIVDKLKSDNAKSYLLNIGIQGIQRLYAQNGFTESKASAEVFRRYRIENNNVLGFLDDVGDEILEQSTHDVYSRYNMWCAMHGLNPYKLTKVNKTIRENGFLNHTTTRDGQSVQVWRRGG